MTAASALTAADFTVNGTATKTAAGVITVRGDTSGRAVATGVTWSTEERCVIRLDSHNGPGGAIIRWGNASLTGTIFLDTYRSNAYGWFFGQKNAADNGPVADSPPLGPLPVYISLRFTAARNPVFETSTTATGPWTVRRTGYPVAALTDYSFITIEGRDGAAADVHTFAVAASTAPPPPDPNAVTARTVSWNSKSSSNITRPDGLVYRATATLAGNLEAESSPIPVSLGDLDVTLTVKRGAGGTRSGDLYGNLQRADGSYLATRFLGALPQTTDAYVNVTGRITVPDGAATLTLAPAYYLAAIGDAIDLQPSVSLKPVETVTPPPPGGNGGTGLFLAGTPLTPLARDVASPSLIQPQPAVGGTLKQGNFQSHTVQPYSAHTSMWGANLAGNEQMTSTSSLRVFSDFPNRTEFEWSITADPRRPDDVNGFLHLAYGNYDWTPSRLPADAVRQVKDITALDVSTTWMLTNTSGSAPGLLAELWLSPEAAAQGQFPKSHEIAFFPRLSPAVITYVQSLVPVGPGSFTDSFGVLWNVVEGGSFTNEPYLIAYRPGNIDFEGRLPFLDLLAFLRANNKISGNEWINGLAFGVEPRNGAGKLAVDTFTPTYTYGPVTADVVAYNRLVNGDFGQGDAGWSGFYFSGKSISAGKAVFAATPAFDGIARPLSLVAGKFYDVSMRITGYSAGDVRVQFSGGTTRDGTARASNGVFTQRLQANTGNTTYNLLPGGSGFTGSVQNLTVVGPYDTA